MTLIRKKMGNNSRELVESEFSSEIINSQTLKLYETRSGKYYLPKYDLLSGGHELLNFFKKIQLLDKEILQRKTTRLLKLKYLRSLNKINEDLYFE